MAVPYETLKKRSQFVRVARKGDRCFSTVCSIQFLKAQEEQGVRIGFTATKRLGNAVIRNFAKRRMRSYILDLLKKNVLTQGDYVLIAQKDILDLPYDQVSEQITHSFHKKKWGRLTGNSSSVTE